LTPTGVVGPLTVAALNGAGPAGSPSASPILSAPPLPWYEEANRHLGLRETAGAGTSSAIAAWLKRLKASWADDETPWCGTFVGWCIASTLPGEALPANPFAARNWLKFGIPCKPRRGAILVFSRPGQAWSGHVGFYAAEDREAFHVLGGNQSDAVTITRIRRDRILGARWPRTARAGAAGRIWAAGKTSLSTNEA
jgi:uncharacterized protein (TIGR02594 family)